MIVMRRNYSYLIVTALVIFNSGECRAITVADGCANPGSAANRNTFYVDPAKGNMSNDGSAARPWRTLAEVLDNRQKLVSDQNGQAPIKPGDVVFLNSGDHGNVEISNLANKEFITVQASPGHTPTLRSLRINAASKWMFVGLKIQGTGDGSSDSSRGVALIEFGRDLRLGPTNDIVLVGSSISTVDDSTLWSPEDWVKKPFLTALATNATCVTISGNHFFNLRNAVGVEGAHSLVADNRIERFGNDAINLVASDLVVRNNTIRDGRHSRSEQLHADGIQGWTKKGETNVNVTIEGNTIINSVSNEEPYLQGITVFDGKWERLRILNNVVVTNTWHGIAISGVTDAQIINNTVIACNPTKFSTWITVKKAKDGSLPKKVIIRNNIATRLDYYEEGVTVDHNIVAKMIATSSEGKPVFISKPGDHGNNNFIDPNIFESLVSVDHSKAAYDLRPKPSSPAVGRGNAEYAPKKDIAGKNRNASIDIGAYAR